MRVKVARIVICLALCISLAAVLAPARAVDAATPIYVNASRPDDTGDGTSWATAKKYIQSGINTVDPGGAVYVAAGTYVEQVIINKNLTLAGTGNPMIQAPASPAYYTFPEGDTNQWEPVVLAFGGTADGNRNITGAGQVTVNI